MTEALSPGLMAFAVGMQDRPVVPAGWDMVLNLSQPAVQSLVWRNWDGVMGAGDRDRPLLWVAPGAVEGQHDIVVVRSALPRPAVRLNPENHAVDLHFGIDTGTLRVGKVSAALLRGMPDRRALVDHDAVAWAAPVAITPQDPLQLSGSLPVTAGLVTGAGPDSGTGGRGFSIGLALTDPPFVLSGMQNGLLSDALNQPLQAWVAGQHLSGQIGMIALPDGRGPTVLTPTTVSARVAIASDGQPVLQILTGASFGAAVPAMGAPAPSPDAHDFSLMVSSKATMAMIASGYNLGRGVVKLVSVPPEDGQPHWFVQVHQPMVFEGRFGNQNGEIYLTDRASFTMGFGGSADTGLTLFTRTDPASTVRLELDLAAQYPVAISGIGEGQVVGLRDGSQSVTGDGFYEAIVKPQLEAFLYGDIRTDMAQVRMTALSDLVLKDLTLSGHTLLFETAALPAELLVTGRLIPTA